MHRNGAGAVHGCGLAFQSADASGAVSNGVRRICRSRSREWTAAYALNLKVPPKGVPKLREVIRLIALLGGFLGSKHDGEPGSKTLWLGLRDVAVSVAVMQAMRDG